MRHRLAPRWRSPERTKGGLEEGGAIWNFSMCTIAAVAKLGELEHGSDVEESPEPVAVRKQLRRRVVQSRRQRCL